MATIVELDWVGVKHDGLDPKIERLAFHDALGRAITQWAGLERQLSDIVLACLPDANRKTILRGYYSIENFRSKLKFIDSLMQTKFAKDRMLDEWASVMGRVASASQRRNSLAHQGVTIDTEAKAGKRYSIRPWVIKEAKRPAKQKSPDKKPPDGTLFLRDIIQARLEFHALMCVTANFAARLTGQVEPFPKSAELPASPPTIRNIKDQIHAILGLQP